MLFPFSFLHPFVFNPSVAIPNESNKQMKHPCEDDDNSSDYFADDETSSCGSFDLDTEWSDSEDEGM